MNEIIADYSLSVQPLVFETGLDEFMYSTAGTVFLVGYKGHAFAVTTRHGLRPDSLCPICIFPSDMSRQLVPLDDVFFVPARDEPEDYMDLAVIAIDTPRIKSAEVGAARPIALAPSLVGWPQYVAELVVLGFPEDRVFVDPESQLLQTQRVTH